MMMDHEKLDIAVARAEKAEAERDAALNANVQAREVLESVDGGWVLSLETAELVRQALSDTPAPDYMAVVKAARDYFETTREAIYTGDLLLKDGHYTKELGDSMDALHKALAGNPSEIPNSSALDTGDG